ncbi:hypothetical protein [Sphingomonas faeni]|uniref:hypothetical protein n=1 Tax=Sphingomonas faeni TaxID=185950 RepID=UPI0020C7C261|nr:hypothetical protein [Sphingomonas faeni]MCP8892522.1 hypothetical protein [Sphingomonas faeni]
MIRLQEGEAAALGQRASEIASLCDFLAEALQADPDTVNAGTAVEGLGTLASNLARDLLILADPNA